VRLVRRHDDRPMIPVRISSESSSPVFLDVHSRDHQVVPVARQLESAAGERCAEASQSPAMRVQPVANPEIEPTNS